LFSLLVDAVCFLLEDGNSKHSLPFGHSLMQMCLVHNTIPIFQMNFASANCSVKRKGKILRLNEIHWLNREETRRPFPQTLMRRRQK